MSNKEYYLNNRDKIIENQKEYYKNNRDKVKEYHKEYHLNNPWIFAWSAINNRCSDLRFQETHPTYRGCVNKLEQDEFYNYFKTNMINGIVNSVDKDSILLDTKEYSMNSILIIPIKLNKQLHSIETCSISNKSCTQPNGKYQLQMDINGKHVHFGCYTNIEDHHRQKSITNAYKSIKLFENAYLEGEITRHTWLKFTAGDVFNYWFNLSKNIKLEHKQKIDKLLQPVI